MKKEEKAAKAIDDAIKAGVLHEGASGGVMVYKVFEDGSEGWQEVSKAYAAKDLVAQDALQTLINATHDVMVGSKVVKSSLNTQQAFETNEDCANGLFNFLVSIGKANASDSFMRESILHDINNLRGREWLDILERNITTKPFFDYIGGAEFFEDEFIYGRGVAPNIFLKIAIEEEFPENTTFDQVRTALDDKGLQDLWDFPVEDLDEALANLSDDMWLLGVSFYEDGGYFARIFEITQEMADRFEKLLVHTQLGDCVLPSDIMKPRLDSQIQASSAQNSLHKTEDNTRTPSKNEAR